MKLISIPLEDLLTGFPLPRSRKAHQPHDSRVLHSPDNRELTKVLVQSHEHSRFSISMEQDLVVTGVLVPIANPPHVVPMSLELTNGLPTDAGIEENAQVSTGFQQSRLDTFVANQTARIDQTRLNVLTFEPGVSLEQTLRSIPRGQHPQDMLYSEALSPDDGFAPEDLGVDRDPLK